MDYSFLELAQAVEPFLNIPVVEMDLADYLKVPHLPEIDVGPIPVIQT